MEIRLQILGFEKKVRRSKTQYQFHKIKIKDRFVKSTQEKYKKDPRRILSNPKEEIKMKET